jgi:hypothetical protein
MKKYGLSILAILLVFAYSSCTGDTVVFDNVNGQEAIQFTEKSFNITVPPAGITATLPVSVTTLSTADRTFEAVADETSTGPAASYSIGSATIPAGSYEGTLKVDLKTTTLKDGIAYSLLVKLVAPVGGAAFNEVATIKYNKKVVCNDVVLTVVTDAYPEETSWKIKDATGKVVASIAAGTYGPASSASSRGKVYTHNINLPNGKYTLVMEDVYCDGQFDGAYNGSYKLDCSIINHASGTGAFGCEEITAFEINP